MNGVSRKRGKRKRRSLGYLPPVALMLFAYFSISMRTHVLVPKLLGVHRAMFLPGLVLGLVHGLYTVCSKLKGGMHRRCELYFRVIIINGSLATANFTQQCATNVVVIGLY